MAWYWYSGSPVEIEMGVSDEGFRVTQTTYPLQWDLDSLNPDPETDQFAQQFAQFSSDLSQLALEAERLPVLSTDSASQWVALLKNWERLRGQWEEFESHLGCHAAADAENRTYQQWEAQLAARVPDRENVLTALELSLGELTEKRLDEVCEAEPWLSEVRFFLEDLSARARLRLPAEQEQLAAELAVDGRHAWGRLYDRVSGSLRIPIMIRGEVVERSPSQVQFDSPERSVRENNFYAADKAWSSVADICAEAINHIAGDRLTRYRRIGLQDHLEAPLILNRMQRKTLDVMWEAITDRKASLCRYLNAKARLLGIDRLNWYDLTAPLPQSGSSTKLDYGSACRTIVETFSEFSSELGEFAQHALSQGWVEAENRSGKRQGGFCTDFPVNKETRIFMTFTDSADSMSTLAHELGHAYHAWVLRDHPVLLQDYPMNLAETASTFAEAVLGQKRLELAGSNEQKLVIYDGMLSDSVAFLMNIHARFLFEDRFHQQRLAGEVPRERLCELMVESQREAYTDSLGEQGWNANFWVSKLHFYITELPFYNFPYTFGYLLSLGVYALADELGDDFPLRYRDLLIASGGATAEDALQNTLGQDLTDRAFWDRSLDIIDERIEKFLALAQ